MMHVLPQRQRRGGHVPMVSAILDRDTMLTTMYPWVKWHRDASYPNLICQALQSRAHQFSAKTNVNVYLRLRLTSDRNVKPWTTWPHKDVHFTVQSDCETWHVTKSKLSLRMYYNPLPAWLNSKLWPLVSPECRGKELSVILLQSKQQTSVYPWEWPHGLSSSDTRRHSTARFMTAGELWMPIWHYLVECSAPFEHKTEHLHRATQLEITAKSTCTCEVCLIHWYVKPVWHMLYWYAISRNSLMSKLLSLEITRKISTTLYVTAKCHRWGQVD